MAIILYGIPNCDTVRKARKWLEAHGVDYSFHNFKTSPPSAERIAAWIESVGANRLQNKRGTTFRKLSDSQKSEIDSDPAAAIRLMAEYPAMIKRPVVEHPGGVLVGFDESEWRESLL